MKLRPTTKDRKAIEKLKKHYGEATGTKAILRAVYDVPQMDADIAKLSAKVIDLNNMLERAAQAQRTFVDSIQYMKHSVSEIRKR